ncbi:MAG: hypothetical protein OEY88_00625 [Candidatus Bathyarchaeota archaeon]|nr:hypothetical protein [Candidatus Bathyarchaeota archaeon]
MTFFLYVASNPKYDKLIYPDFYYLTAHRILKVTRESSRNIKIPQQWIPSLEEQSDV